MAGGCAKEPNYVEFKKSDQSIIFIGKPGKEKVTLVYNVETMDPLEIHAPGISYLSLSEIHRRGIGHDAGYKRMPVDLYNAAVDVIKGRKSEGDFADLELKMRTAIIDDEKKESSK